MNSNLEKSEADFIRLLRDVTANRASPEALLENPLFKSRLRLITMTLARTTPDAEELANTVRFKVWQNLEYFEPDLTKPYGNFFAWVRSIAQNIIRNTSRQLKMEFAEQPVEDLTIRDSQIDIEGSLLYHEVITEFEKSINALPDRERLAIACYLQGFTVREISDKMQQAGFSFSHITIAKWIRDGISAYLKKSGNFESLENIRSKNVRVKKVRATRARREFHTIVDQAITSGTPTSKSEDTSNNASESLDKRNSSKTTGESSRPGWASANELLKLMQSSESKQGIQAAFEASPKALGRAAVEYSKARKISVSSLASLLMEASTINVVGRVMNLTKDVA